MSLIIGIGTRIGRRVNKALNKWHTVVSQLQAMFLYRIAGGADNDDLPESNGRAVINAIYGNTIKWNQLLAEGRLVDMGLPSGTLWATSNIDITQEDGFAASPFQYGCTLFSWGNVEGHNTPASGTTFSYDWGGVNAQEPWYDGQPYGSTPGAALATSIMAGDTQDAARYNLGSLFKMPTSTQFRELFDNCDFVQADGTTVINDSVTDKRVTINDIVGIYLKSKVNGNLIFFSASGRGNERLWYNRGAVGNYWSASFGSSRDARDLSFGSGGVYPQNGGNRYYGFAVRAVVEPSATSEIGHDNHKFCLTSNHKNMVDLTALEYPNIASTTPTVAQVEAWLALNVGEQDYYPYDEGSLISFKGQGVRTVKNNVELDRKPFDVTKVYGKLRGEGSLVQVFPDGMNSVDSVHDSLTASEAVVKIVSVDLGSLTWDAQSTTSTGGTQYMMRSKTLNNMIKKPANNSIVANVICPLYNAISSQNTWLKRSGISVSNVGYVDVYDPNYNTQTSYSAFKTAMNGVMFYYELATPITYTDLIYSEDGGVTSTPLTKLKYKVDKYSTEEVLVPTGDAPTSTSMIADIEYQAR